MVPELGYEWNENIDSELYTHNGGLFFRATLQGLYMHDNDGEEMHDPDNGYVKIDDYLAVCEKYFPADPEEVRELLINNSLYEGVSYYNRETDSVFMAEGLGGGHTGNVEKIEIDGELIMVYYRLGDLISIDEDTGEWITTVCKGILTIRRQGDEFSFLSNKKCDEGENIL